MMNLNDFETYKTEILKCEIGTLLFNLGKTHVGFWKNFFPNEKIDFTAYTEYYEKKYFEWEISRINQELHDFIKSININFPSSSKNQIKWEESFKGVISSEDLFNKIFFRGCENINSGIDKGAPKQQLKLLWISNAFGSFKEKVNIKYFDQYRKCFFINLDKFLYINGYYARQNNISHEDWSKLRNFVVKEIKEWYSHLLSDTRFPVNDVTLWDQVYMSASMFKATLSSMILSTKKDFFNDNKNKFDNSSNIKWSILGVQYDKLALAEKGLKPAHIEWYREASYQVDEAVKSFFENEFPLGNEVYRDETGIYFLIAEELKGNNNINGLYALNKDIKPKIEEKIIEIFEQTFEGEVYPAIFVTESSRRIGNLGYLVDKAKNNYLKSKKSENFERLITNGYDNSPQGVCQVCGIRMANKKNDDYLICNVCKRRRDSKLNNWLSNRTNETIWTGEVQDKNGKIAVVTLKFELNQWLNGNLLSTMLINKEGNFSNLVSSLKTELDSSKNNTLKVEKTILSSNKLVDGALNSIDVFAFMRNIVVELTIGTDLAGYFKSVPIVGNKVDWSKLSEDNKTVVLTIFLQFILQKGPSPARLKRTWDSTKIFFEEMQSKMMNLLDIPDERRKRLVWKNIDLPDGEYYDGDIDFWVKDKNVYLITSIEKIENKKEFNLKSYDPTITNPATLKLENAKQEFYLPYFSIIDPTPISWQFAIPADRVTFLLENIEKEYFNNFRWVYGKLPLHVGIIVQNYKKPLYVAIKASRKIRRDNISWKNLRIIENYSSIKQKQQKAFNCANSFEADEGCKDYYSLLEKVNGKGAYDFYLYFDINQPIPLGYVDGSNGSDNFYIYPNTFDFEFLETNTRRNDIFYDDKGKRVIKEKLNRSYDLEDYKYFKLYKEFFDKKESGKSQKLVSFIYSKLKDWSEDQESIKIFFLSAFINVLDLKTQDEKNNFASILKFKDWKELSDSTPEIFIERLYLLLDMFDFYHNALNLI